jgi:hypothetical protein
MELYDEFLYKNKYLKYKQKYLKLKGGMKKNEWTRVYTEHKKEIEEITLINRQNQIAISSRLAYVEQLGLPKSTAEIIPSTAEIISSKA